jgi:hypothetical protein
MISTEDLKALLSSHDDLRSALIIADKRIRKLQFGRKNDDPVLAHLRTTLSEARAIRKKASKNRSGRTGSIRTSKTLGNA